MTNFSSPQHLEQRKMLFTHMSASAFCAQGDSRALGTYFRPGGRRAHLWFKFVLSGTRSGWIARNRSGRPQIVARKGVNAQKPDRGDGVQ
jgi:hypothetical protein